MIANICYLERGKLIGKPEYYDLQSWSPGEAERFTPILYDCFEKMFVSNATYKGFQTPLYGTGRLSYDVNTRHNCGT